jgi:hypothetical protein
MLFVRPVTGHRSPVTSFSCDPMTVRTYDKVLIGGAPITQKYADEIGADGYSENAVGAVALAKRAVALTA